MNHRRLHTVLARALTVDGLPAGRMTIVTLRRDGLVAATEPFRREIHSTPFVDTLALFTRPDGALFTPVEEIR